MITLVAILYYFVRIAGFFFILSLVGAFFGVKWTKGHKFISALCFFLYVTFIAGPGRWYHIWPFLAGVAGAATVAAIATRLLEVMFRRASEYLPAEPSIPED